MTKVQTRFPLAEPIDDTLMGRIAEAHSLFGMLRVQITEPGTLEVEYDASRLTPAQVAAALRGAGIPVRQQPG